jgi:hypothetical protein
MIRALILSLFVAYLGMQLVDSVTKSSERHAQKIQQATN